MAYHLLKGQGDRFQTLTAARINPDSNRVKSQFSTGGYLKMKRAITVLLVAIFLVWGPAAGLVKAQEKKAVRVAGAGLLSEWLQEGSDRYMKDARTCSVTISGATTGIGVQRLLEGNAELGALTIG
jgi:hypothetical protein